MWNRWERKRSSQHRLLRAADPGSQGSSSSSGGGGGGGGAGSGSGSGKNGQNKQAQATAEDASCKPGVVNKNASFSSVDEPEGLQQEDAAAKGTPQDTSNGLSRRFFLVFLICVSIALAVASVVSPAQVLDPIRHALVIASSIGRYFSGPGSAREYTLEAVVCILALVLMRFALQPLAKAIYFWWTDSTSDKAWQSSVGRRLTGVPQ